MSSVKKEHSFVDKITRIFVDSKLTPLIVAASILLGLFSVFATPREEEPQIKVPMYDVIVAMPGASSKEVEERVTIPMEKKLWEIPGVEYIYSTASEGMNLTVVRFYVGEDEEKSLTKLYNKLFSNFDIIPPGATQPLIKFRSIDDVPILALTLHSDKYSNYELRRIAAQLCDQIKDINDVSETNIIGGYRRKLNVEVLPERLAGHGITAAEVYKQLSAINSSLHSGVLTGANKELLVETGGFITSKEDLEKVVLNASGKPVFLRDIARINDGPEEVNNYVLYGEKGKSELTPAVTISVAKRKGKNATVIAEKVLEKVNLLKGRLIPNGVDFTVTRNYGETAKEKSDELLKHLIIAVVSVTILIALFLGIRAGAVVFIAVPVVLALTLAVYYFYGYTLNRVTLFALIFSIGILVDDPIVDVENIVRHFYLPENKNKSVIDTVVGAVSEVRSPLILATLTVIAAILPMAMVRGLMGPYMRPIPVGASVAMLLSMVVAFMVTPWAAAKILAPLRHKEAHHEKEDKFTKLYRHYMGLLINSPKHRHIFLVSVVLLFLASCSLIYFKLVRVKMLPFDNKSEFQIVIDMPEGTTLEKTYEVTKALSDYIRKVPEVTNYQLYVGTSAPYNFNGLVRHYYMRQQPNQADIQVNLLPKHERSAQSHDIAKRIRPEIENIAKRFNGARVKIVEIPPGPPVLQTLVAEIYGPDYTRQIEIAKDVVRIFETTEGVVDVDWYVEDDQEKIKLSVDYEKAGRLGVTSYEILENVSAVLQGKKAGLMHKPTEKEDVDILVRTPKERRSSLSDLLSLKVRAKSGSLVPIGEVVKIEKTVGDKSIYRKNLKRAVYVTADVSGKEESPVYAILKLNKKLDELKLKEGYKLEKHVLDQPFSTEKYAMKWDGEWHITYEVFRDLGLAFGAVLILIYILIVGWFGDYLVPLVIMAPIPLSLVGIIPGHAVMGAFFTATSMIGFIAGAGIVVRNSIILGDFIELRLQEGMPLEEAVIDAGAVRFRPMLLTASAVVVGSFVILFDPIFQGLAISLMAGEVAATLLSRMVVPVLYYLHRRRQLG
ncbi:MAG: efflux RND transporter permease subunit [bacterium]